MRRLNVKFLLYLTGGLFAFAGLLFAVHKLQAASIACGLLWQAGQAEKEGRFSQEARYLRRYLEFAPNDLDSRARLGCLLADPRLAVTQSARDRARFCLEEVLAQDPEQHEVRRALVRLALDAHAFDLAEDHLAILRQKCPQDGEVAGLLGRLQELKGAELDAVASLREGVRQAPDVADNYVRLIQLLRRQDGGRRGEHYQEAEALLATALAKVPDDAGVLLAAADLAQDRGDRKQARAHLERALDLHPKNVKAYSALARLELREDKRSVAMALLRKGLQAVHKEDRYELNWTLANLLIDTGELEEAKSIMSQIAESASSGTTDYLQARCLMHQGRWLEAVRHFERARPGFKSVPSLSVQVDLLMSACYESLDEPAQQLAASMRALEVDRASVLALQGIASAHWALGNPDTAITAYRQVVEINQARGLRPTGHVELARMLLKRELQREPRDWKDFLLELDAAEKEQLVSPETALMRAEMHATEKRFDDAQAVLLRMLQVQPRNVTLWIALAALSDRREEPDKALTLLDQAEEEVGDSPELRLARVRHWSGRPKEQAMSALRRLEEGLEKYPAEKLAAVLNGLAEAHLRLDNPADASRLWNQLVAQPSHANDLRLRMLLFDVAMQQKDDAAIQKALDDIKTLENGESALWLFGQASRKLAQARQGDRKVLEEARTLLDKAAALRPNWPAVLLARAELEELQGNVEQAIAGYRRAVEGGVRSPQVVRQLVQLLMTRQRYEEAEQMMRHLHQGGSSSKELQLVGVAMALQQNDVRRAMQMVKSAVSENSTDYRDHLWSGQVLAMGRRRSPEVEKAFRRAIELADTKPETWVAFVQYLASTDQRDLAKAEVEKARAKLSGPLAALALAQCYEYVGELEKAREQYRAALQERPHEMGPRRAYIGFCLRAGNLAEAERTLREIVAGKVQASDVEAAWARRALALTLASMSDPKRSAEALALTGFTSDAKGNVTEGPAPPGGYAVEEQIARARVLASQGRKTLRERAITILEDLNKRQALPADEQLLLAQLYQRNGDDLSWAKARDLMQTLTAAQSRNVMYLTLYAQALLDHNDLREAEKTIAKLEAVEKDRPPSAMSPATELKARALEARGKHGEALALLKSYAAADGAPPERLLLGAGLHGRVGEVKEALDLCEQARPKCQAEIVCGAGVAVLRAARAKLGQDESAWRTQAVRVESWLKEALTKNPDGVPLYLQMADILDLLGRDAEVEAHYRQVLQRDPRNFVALNNLAWLMAQRPNQTAEGLKLIQQAIDVHGSRAELLDTRAVLYLAMNQADKAVADLEQAVADGPTPTKLFHLSRAYHSTRNTRAAQQALTRATAAGLTAERLHPAEREAFRRLQAELKQ